MVGGTVNSVFSDYGKFQRWIKVQKVFMKFVLLRKNYRKARIEEILRGLEIHPFEIMKDMDGYEDDYEFFKGCVMAKSPEFNLPEFMCGLDYLGLCNISDSLLIKEWNWIMFEKLKRLKEKLKELAFQHKNLVQIGRTHGVHGEPTSFGYRFAVVYSDLDRYIHSIFEIRKYVEDVAFDYESLLDPNMGKDLQAFLSKELDLFVGVGNSFYISRGCYFNFISVLNGLVQTINKHTTDLTLLSSGEIGEVDIDEGVYEKMVKIELLSRDIDGKVNSYIDLENSVNVERIEFYKKGTKLIYGVLKGVWEVVNTFYDVVCQVKPDVEAIAHNLFQADESIYSQKVLLYLIHKTGYSRTTIADHLKKMTAQIGSGEYGVRFKDLLVLSPYRKYLTDGILEKLFNRDHFLANIDDVYGRIFGLDQKSKFLKKVLWDENEIYYAMEKLAIQINQEYSNTKMPVTVIAFAERGLVFAGNLISKLNFPMVFKTIPHKREDLEIASISFDRKLVQSKRVLILDFLVHTQSNLDHFMDKMREIGEPFDFKICSLLKFKNVTDENFVVNWCGFECEPDDFYAGFGKNCGSSEFFRHLPVIGLAA